MCFHYNMLTWWNLTSKLFSANGMKIDEQIPVSQGFRFPVASLKTNAHYQLHIWQMEIMA